MFIFFLKQKKKKKRERRKSTFEVIQHWIEFKYFNFICSASEYFSCIYFRMYLKLIDICESNICLLSQHNSTKWKILLGKREIEWRIVCIFCNISHKNFFLFVFLSIRLPLGYQTLSIKCLSCSLLIWKLFWLIILIESLFFFEFANK